MALERDVRHLEEQVQLGAEEGRRQRDEGGEPLLKASRVDGGSADQVDVEAGVSSLAPRVAEAKMALEAWALSLAATPAEVERMKKVIEDFDADAQQLERERGHRAGPEPGARGEIYLKDMTPTEVRLTVPALIKALEIHFEYKAVEPVAIDQVVPKEATLRSRFVIVNKKWLQREFGPKGRLCVGGHLDPQAGEYETSSPTAQLLGHHILLVVTVAKGWRGCGGDITAAFLQGESLPREKPLFVWLPKGSPPEVTTYLEKRLVTVPTWCGSSRGSSGSTSPLGFGIWDCVAI